MPLTLNKKEGQLTQRELEALKLFSLGHSAKEVSSKMQISIGSVNIHSSNIRRKFEAKSMQHAVAIAVTKEIL
jgi:DNA-binding CsgD family transcriptional regulator